MNEAITTAWIEVDALVDARAKHFGLSRDEFVALTGKAYDAVVVALGGTVERTASFGADPNPLAGSEPLVGMHGCFTPPASAIAAGFRSGDVCRVAERVFAEIIEARQ